VVVSGEAEEIAAAQVGASVGAQQPVAEAAAAKAVVERPDGESPA
jgi:ATP-binding cassette, subfamily B, multidrug efflux pump